MITVFLSLLLSCEDANWIIQGIRDTDLKQSLKSELVLEVMVGTEENCDFVLD